MRNYVRDLYFLYFSLINARKSWNKFLNSRNTPSRREVINYPTKMRVIEIWNFMMMKCRRRIQIIFRLFSSEIRRRFFHFLFSYIQLPNFFVRSRTYFFLSSLTNSMTSIFFISFLILLFFSPLNPFFLLVEGDFETRRKHKTMRKIELFTSSYIHWPGKNNRVLLEEKSYYNISLYTIQKL